MIIARDPNAIWTELEGQLFVLSLTNGRYYEFKGIGSFIWQALDEPIERSALVARVVDRYAVSPEQCEADVDRFMDTLKAAGLVLETGATPAVA